MEPEEGIEPEVFTLCSDCAINRDNAHEPVDFYQYGDEGDECEDCNAMNTHFTEDDFDRAVSDMVEMLKGSVGVSMGEFEDRSDSYQTEVLGTIELPAAFEVDIDIGGWVEINDDREHISVLLGMVIEGQSIGECQGFQGEYDKHHGWGQLVWEGY
jgi:hypothetical protein